jgi:hypothetical protein
MTLAATIPLFVAPLATFAAVAVELLVLLRLLLVALPWLLLWRCAAVARWPIGLAAIGAFIVLALGLRLVRL